MDTKTLLDKIALNPEISRNDASKLLESLIKIIGEQGKYMNSVAIPGFGTFEPRRRAERVAVHPSTGKRMLFPPKQTLSFKPSALLKQKLGK